MKYKGGIKPIANYSIKTIVLKGVYSFKSNNPIQQAILTTITYYLVTIYNILSTDAL